MNYMIFIEWIRDNKLNTVKFYNAILTALQKKLALTYFRNFSFMFAVRRCFVPKFKILRSRVVPCRLFLANVENIIINLK